MWHVATPATAPATASSSGPAPPPAPGAARPAPRAPSRTAPIKVPGGEGGKSFTLLYGDDHCYGLIPPKGWAIDDSSGLGAKIRVVLYPRGQKWSTAGTVMYVNPLHLDAKRPQTMAQLIQRDVESFMRNSPRGKVTAAPSVRTSAGKAAELRLFAREGGKAEEAVAYVMEQDLVMLLVLSSRETGGLEKHLPAFREMVSSYQFIAGNIQTPTR